MMKNMQARCVPRFIQQFLNNVLFFSHYKPCNRCKVNAFSEIISQSQPKGKLRRRNVKFLKNFLKNTSNYSKNLL